MRRRTFLAVPALGALSTALSASPAAAAEPVTWTNSIVARRADPHVLRHTDGSYYFTATVPEYDRIVLRRSSTLQGLGSASESVIWRKHATGEMGAHIWAPEIHRIDGSWYIYFAAGAAEDVWAIRPYVLQNTAADPFTGTWVEKGRIDLPLKTFSLDATTFVHGGVRYLAWAQNDPAVGSGTNLYLAPMRDPWTIAAAPARISVPSYGWETVGHRVNEGPAVLQRNGRVFMTFSASATDANYCIGLLTATAGSDLMNAASWSKRATPIFSSYVRTGQYGPGHNCFTVAEDGVSDVLVYHDRNYRDISGDPLDDPNRRTRVQKLAWNADGTPNLGIPVADGVTPLRLRSANLPTRYLRHWEFRAKLEADVTNLADSQFRVVPGLTGSGTVSLESANYPGYYLRHRNFELWVDPAAGTAQFAADASFMRRTGLSDAAGVSLESSNYPGRYLRHSAGLLYLQAVSTSTDRADATFFLE